MRMPSYTTRMMISFMTLATLAAALGVGGAYRIRTSLKETQAMIRVGNSRIETVLRLHDAVEKRRKAESYYLKNGKNIHLVAWRKADKDFNMALDEISAPRPTKKLDSKLRLIKRTNEKAREAWTELVEGGGSSVNGADFDRIAEYERLESLIDDVTEGQTAISHRQQDRAMQNANLTLYATLIFSGLILVLGAIMSGYVSYTLRKPLADLLGATKKISQGQLGHKIDLSRTDEIGALTDAFDEMSQQLHEKDAQITGQLKQLQKTKSLLETYSEDLERKNKEMEGFIYSVSHDLKTPLIAIQGFLAMFADEFNAILSEKARFYLQRVKVNSEQMQTLIQQLLELSRAGETTNRFVSISTRQVTDQVLEGLHIQIASKQAEIRLGEHWPKIVAEPGRIKQALANLIDNALHYGQGDGRLTIEISVEEFEGYWRFYVRDNGIGIDPAYQEKVFDMFERLSGSYEKNRNGTGIGLAIVKKIAESHKGAVGVKSRPGRGSTFYFDVSKDLVAVDKTKMEVQT